MRAGRLRHRVTIQRKNVTGRTASGQEIVTWVNVATVWASIEPQSGREFIAANRETAAINVVIGMRYRAGITAAMRVIKGTSASPSQIWDIEAPIDPDQRHRELQLVCVEQAAAGS